MKLLPAALLLLVFWGCKTVKAPVTTPEEFTGTKYLDIKSCKLVYKFTNGLQLGEKTVVVDNWGNTGKERTATQTDTALAAKMFAQMPASAAGNPFLSEYRNRVMNQTGETNQLVIKDGKAIVTINLDAGEGVRQPASTLPVIDVYTESNYKVLAEENVAGYTCKVVQLNSLTKVWLWNKIALRKEEQKGNGFKLQEYAVDVDQNYRVKANEFEIPKGITIH